MSNTVKIKNRKKKSEIKVNYKLLAIIFGIFVAVIVGLSVWASFHWGVGMGTIGVRPVTPEEPAVAATGATVDAASEFSTDNVITVTPEQLEKMGINVNGTAAEGAEAVEEAAEEAGADAAAADQEAQEADKKDAEVEADAPQAETPVEAQEAEK